MNPDPPVTPRVLIFYDYTCPFCYVDQSRFDRLAEEREDVEFVLVPYELRPDMPEAGYPVSEPEATEMSDRVEEHLLRIAREEGLVMNPPPFLPKTHKAHVLTELARDQGASVHRAVHQGIFEAYFARSEDIGDPGVLLGLVERVGLETGDVRRAWDEGAYDARLHEYRHLAMHLGVQATPAAFICNELLIGSRPYRVLKESIDRCMLAPGTLGGDGEQSAE